MSASNTVYFELQKSTMSSVIPGLNMKSAFETELVPWFRLPAAESCKGNSIGVLHIFLVMEETHWQNKRIIFSQNLTLVNSEEIIDEHSNWVKAKLRDCLIYSWFIQHPDFRSKVWKTGHQNQVHKKSKKLVSESD